MLLQKVKIIPLFCLLACFSICHASKQLFDDYTSIESRARVKHARILSVDSGGTRGVMPSTVLKTIEERVGLPISKIFHLVGGTSFGCLLTTVFTTPSDSEPSEPKWSADEIITNLKYEAPIILKKYTSWNSLYNTKAFEKFVDKFCKNKTFNTQLIPTIGVTFDCVKLQPKIICSWEEEIFRTQDVILASTALPIALHPRFISPLNPGYCNRSYLVGDGFLGGAGNPTKIILEKAKEYYPNAESFEVVSLGSGTMKFATYREALKPYNIFLKIADIGLNAVNAEPKHIQEDFVGQYTRINPPVTEGGWAFDGSSKNLDHLEQDTYNFLTSEISSDFDALIERLSEPRKSREVRI